MTVARAWITGIEEGRADQYERFASAVSLPMFQEQEGYEGALMFRSGSEAVVLTLWKDERTAEQLQSSPSYAQTVRQIRDGGFLVGKQTVQTFRVHLMDLASAQLE